MTFAPTPPPLGRPIKLAYGVGSMAEAVVISSATQFLLLFYNQVRGLPAQWVGLAIASGLFVNAFVDPLVGSWSDRTHSRLGRRHPFMFAAIVPVALTFFLLFNPPTAMPVWAQLAWLAGFNILLQQAITVFHTPHLAFGAELSTSYLERTRIMSYNTFFLWAGDTACWVASFGLFFGASANFPNGALDPSRYLPFSLTIATLVVVILTTCSFGMVSRIKWLPPLPRDSERFSARAFLLDVRRALGNFNYLMLLLNLFFLSLMQGVRGGLWIYGATYYWRLRNEQIVFFAVGSLIGYAFGALVVTQLHRRLDKRWTGVGAVLAYAIGPTLPFVLGYFGFLRFDTPGLIVILIAFSLLQHLPYSLIATTLYSALADIADENELKYGVRQEGVLFSTQTFFGRIDQAVGSALAGLVLTLTAFPAHAVPGHIPQPVLDELAVAVILSVVPGLVSAWFVSRLRLSRDTYRATRAALDDSVSGSVSHNAKPTT